MSFPFPGPRTPAPGRPSLQIFVGCIPCKTVDVRRDVVAQCQRCIRPTGQLMIRYRCRTCGWDKWCATPVTCSADRTHTLTAEQVAPFDAKATR